MNIINTMFASASVMILGPMLLGLMFFIGKLTYDFFMKSNITFFKLLFVMGIITISHSIYKHFFIA